MRIDRRHIGVDRRRAVDARKRTEIVEKVRCTVLQVSAHIRDGLHPHAEKGTILVERKLGVSHVVARFRVTEKGLGARTQPFDRPADELRPEQRQRRFIEDRGLHAEAAADVAGDHVHAALGDLQHLCREV